MPCFGIIFANTGEKSSQTENKPKTACSIPKCLFGLIFLRMEPTTEVAFSDSRPHLDNSCRPHMWIIIKAPKTLSSITWRVTFHQFYGIADWTDYRGKRGLDGLGIGIRPTATLNTTAYRSPIFGTSATALRGTTSIQFKYRVSGLKVDTRKLVGSAITEDVFKRGSTTPCCEKRFPNPRSKS